MFEVSTPNPVYCGITDGVAFVDGKALVPDAQKAQELQANFGYVVTALSSDAPAKGKHAPKT